MAEWLTLASQQCGPDSIKAQCDMRVNFVDSRMLARLFPVFSGLPTSKKKANIFKFQFDEDKGHALKPVNADAASFSNIVILFRSSVFKKKISVEVGLAKGKKSFVFRFFFPLWCGIVWKRTSEVLRSIMTLKNCF